MVLKAKPVLFPVDHHDPQEEEMAFELDLEGMTGFVRQKWIKKSL